MSESEGGAVKMSGFDQSRLQSSALGVLFWSLMSHESLASSLYPDASYNDRAASSPSRTCK